MCNYVIYYPGEATAGAAVEGEPSNHQLWQKDKTQRQKTKDKIVFVRQIVLQVRYFTPPQADQPEIFIMAEQEGYGGNYGGDGTKPGKYATGLKVGHLQ